MLDSRLRNHRTGITALIAGFLKLLEAELVILLHLAHLLLHLQQLEAEFLDAAIEPTDLLLELADPVDRISGLSQNHWCTAGLSGFNRGWRNQRALRKAR